MKGLTLLELLVVLFLMSLTLALVGPKLGRFLPQPKGDFVTRTFQLLKEARYQAALKGAFRVIVISPEERTITLADAGLKPLEPPLSIPKDVEIKAEGLIREDNRFLITFFPGGLSSGGELELIFYQSGKRVLIRLARTQVYITKESL